ncbi:hypothetical protein LGH83_10520 [Lichenihabitans sp. PAMC28606]|uniref:hypothetical protein n=1 Tax=Lichenihabitans sp. PAMC28606 TaxID=2880932 RepID=UPI001D0A13F3|nr:hypothetical protein [Lichenihabitans sp. PAMC28606]UDL93064.1 hypothetical protein LGH83_10520 [Lichenihabitans sp. PAMC28606]
MRLVKAAAVILLFGIVTPVAAGELLLIDKAQTSATEAAPKSPGDEPRSNDPSSSEVPPRIEAEPTKTAAPAKPARAILFGGIYDAPVFNRANGGPTAARVDESALRYYASQKNHARVDAEIRRLKTLNPGWKVPTNLYTADAGGNGKNEQPLWDLFAADKLTQLRAAISLRMLQDNGWRPSADLAAKIEIRDATDRLVQASDAKAWTRVLEVASATPSMLICSAIDNNWRVAQAFAETGVIDRAFEVYQAILSSCTDRDERLATVRKAVAILPVAKVEDLIGMGTVLADGSHEFDAVRVDLVRGALGKFASGETNDQVPPDSVRLFGDTATASNNAADATLLGWYFYKLKKWGDADQWFKQGLALLPDDPKLQEGHVLSLRNLGHLDEAQKLAYQWRQKSPALRGLYLGFEVAQLTRETPPPTISAADLAEFTTVVTTDHMADGAQALAWYSYNRKDWQAAVTWFKLAVDWTIAAPPAASAMAAADGSPSGTAAMPPAAPTPPAVPTSPATGQPIDKVDPKTIAGYALALRNLGRFEEAETIAFMACDRSADVRQIFVAIAITQLTKPGQTFSPERLDRFAQVIKKEQSQQGASALGWHALGADNFADAIDWFSASNVWSPDHKGDVKANEGLALAFKGAGRFEAAEDLAYDWMAKSTDMRAVYRDTVVVELTRDDLAAGLSEARLNRFATVVDRDKLGGGAQALGWYRLHQNGCGYAVGWFNKAVAWSPDKMGDAKVNEGLAQALQTVGHYAEAETLTYAWKDRAPDMKALFVKIAVDVLTRDAPVIATTEARLTRYAEVITSEKSAIGAQALAWHRYRETNCGYGAQWFALAAQWSPDRRGDAKMNEGYALSLRQVGQLAAAEEVLYGWADRVPTMKSIYVDVVVSELTGDNPPMPMDDPRLGRFIGVITPIRSALGAQAIAWYRHARAEDADAVKWFKTALDWWPPLTPEGEQIRDPVVDDYQPVTAKLALVLPDYRRTPRAYSGRTAEISRKGRSYVDTYTGLATTWTGYVMALTGIGRTAEAEQLAYDWRDRWPAMHDLFVNLAVTALTKTNPVADIPPDRLKRYADMFEMDRSSKGAQALGWYDSAKQNWTEAAVWFKSALDWRTGTDLTATADLNVQVGYVLALRHLKRFDEALAIAATLRGLSPAMASLYLDTSLDQLSGGGATPVAADRLADLTGAVTSSRNMSGATSLGYYFYAQKDFPNALTWFRFAVTWATDGKVDPKAAEGLTLTYRALGRDPDALTFVAAWRERIPSLGEQVPGLVAEMLSQNDSSVTVPPDQMAKITSLVAAERSSEGARALGWNATAHKDWNAAVEWFRAATTWSADHKGDIKIAEGYASALRNLGRYDEAQAVAYAWYNAADGAALRSLYVDTVAERLARSKPPVAMSTDDLQKFATAVLTIQSPNGAQALGWYSYNSGQFKPALAWFTKALSWEPSEGEALGLAMSYRRVGDLANFASTIETYRTQFPRLGEALKGAGGRGAKPQTMQQQTMAPAVPTTMTSTVSIDPPPQVPQATPQAMTQMTAEATPEAPQARLVMPVRESAPRVTSGASLTQRASRGGGGGGGAAAALQAKDYTRCLAQLGDGERGGRLSGNLMQIKGWCLLGLDRPEEAAIAFGQAQNGQQGKLREDSAYGQSLSLLRSGKTDAAAQVAGGAALSASRRNDIGVQVLTQRVYTNYGAQRWAETLAALNQRAAYAPETRDLRMARGWSLFHLGDYDGAKQIFTQANSQLSDAQSQRALTVLDGTIDPRRKY